MSLFIKNTILNPQNLFVQAKRYRGKINIQRPRDPHYERALFNAVTQPIIPRPTVTELCYTNQLKPRRSIDESKQGMKLADNPYERIIAKEILNWLNQSKMIGIFHMNSINSEDMFKTRVAFFKQNMHLKVYGKSMIRQAVFGTKFESILPLVQSKNCFVFSADAKPAKLLAITKKIPQIILLAAIAENQLLSKNQMIEYANMRDLTMVRSQLTGVLDAIGGGLVQQLQAHQMQLTGLLDQHAASATAVAEESDQCSKVDEVEAATGASESNT